MSGRPYTIKEMKNIVDFVTEHNAYGEIKGRKFWIDYANSKLTKRTWQSLKETFLKRILPDIHNPYYKLTVEQICSFKQGYDVSSTNEHGKLMILRNEKEKYGDTNNSENKNQEITTSGENVNTSKTCRSSTETVVLDKIEDKLVEPSENKNAITTAPAEKSINNYITFSEPLSPFLQQVIDDFDTDEESVNLNPRLIINEDMNKTGKPLECSDNKLDTSITKHDKSLSLNEQDILKDEVRATQNDSLKVKQTTKTAMSTESKIENDLVNHVSVPSPKSSDFTESMIPNNQEAFNLDSMQSNSSKNCDVNNDKNTLQMNSNICSGDPCHTEKVLTDIDEILNGSVNNIQEPMVDIDNCKEKFNILVPKDMAEKNMNEIDNIDNNKDSKNVANEMVNSVEAVVVVQTHCQSQSSDSEAKQENTAVSLSQSRERKKMLTNLFGFTNGVTSKNRYFARNKLSYSPGEARNIGGSESSDWTSESEDGYVSPPRGRKNRFARKYLKPQCGKIFSLDEDGGLFVVNGKKIYPLVKDGRKIKNLLTYLPESSEDMEECFWKLKYAEEKKKRRELEKLLEKMKTVSASEPLLDMIPDEVNSNITDVPKEGKDKLSKDKAPPQKSASAKTVKIKFTKNSQEFQLEGEWTQLDPVFDKIVNIFGTKKGSEQKEIENKKPEPNSIMLSSRETTPVGEKKTKDLDACTKVDYLESRIFKEIEEKDQAETNTAKNNITLRKKRDRSKSSSAYDTKKKKIDEHQSRPHETGQIRENKQTKENVRSKLNNNFSKRKAYLKPEAMKPTMRRNQSKSNTRQSLKLISKQKDDDLDEERDILYKFPSPPRAIEAKDSFELQCNIHKKIISPPDILQMNSLESTQGYQDSDVSIFNNYNRRKKRMPTFSSINFKRNRIHKKSHLFLTSDITSDSSNSASIQKELEKMSSGAEENKKEVDNIDIKVPSQVEKNLPPFENCFKSGISQLKQNTNVKSNSNIDGCSSSSNTSYPFSPELSLVENITFHKSQLSNVEDNVRINVIDVSIQPQNNTQKFVMSDIDVTKPLMGQSCEFQQRDDSEVGTPSEFSQNYMSILRSKDTISESLIDNVNLVKISEETAQDLDEKLLNLQLDSVKKKQTFKENNKINKTDKDSKKKRSLNKRSSTPNKKSNQPKSKKECVQPTIEEHMEFCSSRNSYSFPKQVVDLNDNTIENIPNYDNSSTELSNDKITKRKKRNIIKVKIIKPKNKKKASKNPKLSICTDSEIGTKEFLSVYNDSIALIHNHSDTCLQTKDCVDSSLEVVDNESEMIMTISSDSKMDNLVEEDAVSHTLINEVNSGEYKNNTSNSSFPICSANSLITEDLSDEPRTFSQSKVSNWHLVSDEENSYSPLSDDYPKAENVDRNLHHYEVNLERLFPISYAVPNLSTITELSKDTDENSRKAIFNNIINDNL